MKKCFYQAQAITGEIIKGYQPITIDNKHFMCIFNQDNSASFVEIDPKTIKELRK